MRKLFEAKAMHVHETVDDARVAVRKAADAFESQATLNIALTAISVTALIVAVIVVHNAAAIQGASR